ncbi:LysR substrate-binding domain-containing protein [Lichenifustis flavocetrariae]|uniref:LysR substrate-binding domain-containing protein n=1 Tax=Lichenifustis flavocetrariae TaxID=2949735 RepID=A0AA41Z888_9HYPH|nr:LysR substrate-binding domain-containing protein [Lichenifustis flavocetrariae]MCW6512338.1 LysR substrate-binding domain-containing protein [Lichenifustis flavocetrariae]
MRSIPTDLLRAFVTIIDLKGYTRAGERLGRTQPAISLQMKKLQELVGTPLFDKDGGGNSLTEAGEVVAGYARQILALNDDMILRLSKRDTRGKLRLGITNDYADHFLPSLLAGLTADGIGVTFDVTCDLSFELLKGLRDGRYDMVVAMTPDGPAEGAFMTWRESLTWAGGPMAPPFSETDPVRLVSYPEGCLYRRAMLSALQREGRAFDLVYATPSQTGIEAAVTSGFGVTAIATRVLPRSLRELGPDAGLPRLTDVVVGIYLKEARNRSVVAQSLAARFADMFVGRTETVAA